MDEEKILLWAPRSRVEGIIRAPPSKSYTHRAVFASLLASGESKIISPLESFDTMASLSVIKGFGAEYERGEGEWVISSPGSQNLEWPVSVNVGESGTTLRIATGVAGLLDKPVVFYGTGRIHERPIKPLLEALSWLGVEYIVSRNCCPPHVVRGPARGRYSIIDSTLSSQFLSSLFFLGAGMGELEVIILGLESRPYAEITARVLRGFGARVDMSRDYGWARVEGFLKPSVFKVPGDWSAAAPLLAIGAVAGKVGVAGLDPQDPQPDKMVLSVLREMGAGISGGGVVTAWNSGMLEGVETCIRDAPDLGLVLVALAGIAKGLSRICCLDRLKLKESDRVQAALDLLRRSSIRARLVYGGRGEGLCLEVWGAGGELAGGVEYDSHSDHRVAMAVGVLAAASRKPVVLRNPSVIAKSFPGFWSALRSIGFVIKHV